MDFLLAILLYLAWSLMMQLNFQDIEFFTFNFLLIQIFAVIQNISLTQIFLPVFFCRPKFLYRP